MRDSSKVGLRFKSFGAQKQFEYEIANFDQVPDDRAIICLIDTIQYEMASYAYSRQEFSVLDDDAVTATRLKERIVAGAELERDGVLAFRVLRHRTPNSAPGIENKTLMPCELIR